MKYVANWKMNMDFKEAQKFLVEFKQLVQNPEDFIFFTSSFFF